MTDNEIVKALEWHSNESPLCSPCPYDEHSATHYCVDMLIEDAAALVKRQQAEIERLTETLNATIEGQKTLQRYIAVARADGIKEFAERLIDKAKTTKERFLLESLVESVMKEMGCNDESKI